MQPGRLVFTCAVAAAVTLAGGSNTATTAPPPSFAPASQVDVFGPGPVTIGDVNGDGIPDLVALGELTTGSIAVWLGSGNGSFQPNTTYFGGVGSGQEAVSVALGDLNGDGIPDLASADLSFNTVSVLPGPLPAASIPGFPEAVPGTVAYQTGSFPRFVAIGDLNHDSRLDLVVANSGSNTISVLIADSFGGFLPKSDYLTGTTPVSLAMGDLNGDSDLDVVVATNGSNTISVLLGDGSGGFLPRVNYPTLYHPLSVAIGDLDGTVGADLAVANQNAGVSVLSGNGDGSFQANIDWAQGLRPNSVAIGDLNGDGHADLVVGTSSINSSADSFSVLLGSGDGTFPEQTDYPIGGASGSNVVAAIGDLNGDGRPDLVISADSLWVLLNTSGSPTPVGSDVVVRPVDPATGNTPVTITFANVTAAGDTTLTSSSSGPPPPAGFQVLGTYYELATTAQFDSAEVCFAYASPPAPPPPTIAHYENGWIILTTTRDTGQEVCAQVTSFSPFALMLEDQTAPSVTIATPGDGASYTQDQIVAADYSCQDEPGGSGLASCSGPVLDGSPIDTATVGNHSFAVTATDNAGNTGTVTHTYSVSPCFAPDEPIYIYGARLDLNGYTILDFQDPNQPEQRTGYNVYRSSNPALAHASWPRLGSNVVDMDAGTANLQWVDTTGTAPPMGGVWYYEIAAYNAACDAEGPW